MNSSGIFVTLCVILVATSLPFEQQGRNRHPISRERDLPEKIYDLNHDADVVEVSQNTFTGNHNSAENRQEHDRLAQEFLIHHCPCLGTSQISHSTYSNFIGNQPQNVYTHSTLNIGNGGHAAPPKIIHLHDNQNSYIENDAKSQPDVNDQNNGINNNDIFKTTTITYNETHPAIENGTSKIESDNILNQLDSSKQGQTSPTTIAYSTSAVPETNAITLHGQGSAKETANFVNLSGSHGEERKEQVIPETTEYVIGNAPETKGDTNFQNQNKTQKEIVNFVDLSHPPVEGDETTVEYTTIPGGALETTPAVQNEKETTTEKVVILPPLSDSSTEKNENQETINHITFNKTPKPDLKTKTETTQILKPVLTGQKPLKVTEVKIDGSPTIQPQSTNQIQASEEFDLGKNDIFVTQNKLELLTILVQQFHQNLFFLYLLCFIIILITLITLLILIWLCWMVRKQGKNAMTVQFAGAERICFWQGEHDNVSPRNLEENFETRHKLSDRTSKELEKKNLQQNSNLTITDSGKAGKEGGKLSILKSGLPVTNQADEEKSLLTLRDDSTGKTENDLATSADQVKPSVGTGKITTSTQETPKVQTESSPKLEPDVPRPITTQIGTKQEPTELAPDSRVDRKTEALAALPANISDKTAKEVGSSSTGTTPLTPIPTSSDETITPKPTEGKTSETLKPEILPILEGPDATMESSKPRTGGGIPTSTAETPEGLVTTEDRVSPKEPEGITSSTQDPVPRTVEETPKGLQSNSAESTTGPGLENSKAAKSDDPEPRQPDSLQPTPEQAEAVPSEPEQPILVQPEILQLESVQKDTVSQELPAPEQPVPAKPESPQPEPELTPEPEKPESKPPKPEPAQPETELATPEQPEIPHPEQPKEEPALSELEQPEPKPQSDPAQPEPELAKPEPVQPEELAKTEPEQSEPKPQAEPPEPKAPQPKPPQPEPAQPNEAEPTLPEPPQSEPVEPEPEPLKTDTPSTEDILLHKNPQVPDVSETKPAAQLKKKKPKPAMFSDDDEMMFLRPTIQDIDTRSIALIPNTEDSPPGIQFKIRSDVPEEDSDSEIPSKSETEAVEGSLTSQPDSAQPEPAEPEPTQAESEPPQPDPVQPEPTMSELVQPEPPQAEPAQPEPAQPEQEKPTILEPPQTEPEPEPEQPMVLESTQTEPAEREPDPKPTQPEPEQPQPEPVKPEQEVAMPELEQPEPPQPKLPQPDPALPETELAKPEHEVAKLEATLSVPEQPQPEPQEPKSPQSDPAQSDQGKPTLLVSEPARIRVLIPPGIQSKIRSDVPGEDSISEIPSKPEPAQPGQDTPTLQKPPQPDPAQSEPEPAQAEPEPPQPDPVQPDLPQTEPEQPEPAQPELEKPTLLEQLQPAQPDSEQPESEQQEPAKLELEKQKEPEQPQSAQPELEKPESLEPPQPEPVTPEQPMLLELSKPESAQLEKEKPTLLEPPPPEPVKSQPESAQPASEQPEPEQQEPARLELEKQEPEPPQSEPESAQPEPEPPRSEPVIPEQEPPQKEIEKPTLPESSTLEPQSEPEPAIPDQERPQPLELPQPEPAEPEPAIPEQEKPPPLEQSKPEPAEPEPVTPQPEAVQSEPEKPTLLETPMPEPSQLEPDQLELVQSDPVQSEPELVKPYPVQLDTVPSEAGQPDAENPEIPQELGLKQPEPVLSISGQQASEKIEQAPEVAKSTPALPESIGTADQVVPTLEEKPMLITGSTTLPTPDAASTEALQPIDPTEEKEIPPQVDPSSTPVIAISKDSPKPVLRVEPFRREVPNTEDTLLDKKLQEPEVSETKPAAQLKKKKPKPSLFSDDDEMMFLRPTIQDIDTRSIALMPDEDAPPGIQFKIRSDVPEEDSDPEIPSKPETQIEQGSPTATPSIKPEVTSEQVPTLEGKTETIPSHLQPLIQPMEISLSGQSQPLQISGDIHPDQMQPLETKIETTPGKITPLISPAELKSETVPGQLQPLHIQTTDPGQLGLLSLTGQGPLRFSTQGQGGPIETVPGQGPLRFHTETVPAPGPLRFSTETAPGQGGTLRFHTETVPAPGPLRFSTEPVPGQGGPLRFHTETVPAQGPLRFSTEPVPGQEGPLRFHTETVPAQGPLRFSTETVPGQGGPLRFHTETVPAQGPLRFSTETVPAQGPLRFHTETVPAQGPLRFSTETVPAQGPLRFHTETVPAQGPLRFSTETVPGDTKPPAGVMQPTIPGAITQPQRQMVRPGVWRVVDQPRPESVDPRTGRYIMRPGGWRIAEPGQQGVQRPPPDPNQQGDPRAGMRIMRPGGWRVAGPGQQGVPRPFPDPSQQGGPEQPPPGPLPPGVRLLKAGGWRLADPTGNLPGPPPTFQQGAPQPPPGQAVVDPMPQPQQDPPAVTPEEPKPSSGYFGGLW